MTTIFTKQTFLAVSIALSTLLMSSNASHDTTPYTGTALQNVSENPPSPLTQCQGDCDSDSDCAGNLKCWHRDNDTDPLPPGCSVTGDTPISWYDYCYDDDPSAIGVVQFIASDPNYPLQVCQGDCDLDSHCGEGLICFHDYQWSTSGKIPGCIGTPTSNWDYCSVDPSAASTTTTKGAGGDPHVDPVMADPYSIHPQCEMILTKSENFKSGLGLDVFIRTTRVDKPNHMSYSYISGAAVKIGPDVVEVQEDGSLIFNGNDEFLNDDIATLEFGGSFSLTKTMKGKKNNVFVYDLKLGTGSNDDMSIQIRANIRTGMIFVHVSGPFPNDSVGLLGSPLHTALFGRDGKTDLTNHWNALGEDWQVRSHEPKLFQDKNYVPQFPAGCIYEEQAVLKSNLRRRLKDVELLVSPDEAEEACARASGTKKKFCIDDVLATGDVELADDSFYYA